MLYFLTLAHVVFFVWAWCEDVVSLCCVLWTLFASFKWHAWPAPSVLELHQFTFHNLFYMCSCTVPVFSFSALKKNNKKQSLMHSSELVSKEYSKLENRCWHYLLLFGVKMILIMVQQWSTRGQKEKKLKCLHGFKVFYFFLTLQCPDTNVQSMTQLRIFSSGFSSVQTPC